MDDQRLAGVHSSKPEAAVDKRPKSKRKTVKGPMSVHQQKGESGTKKKTDLLNGNASESDDDADEVEYTETDEEEPNADTSLLQQSAADETKPSEVIENDVNANIQGKEHLTADDGAEGGDEATKLLNPQKLQKRQSTIEREKRDRTAAWFEAVTTSDVTSIKWLLETGLDVNTVNEVKRNISMCHLPQFVFPVCQGQILLFVINRALREHRPPPSPNTSNITYQCNDQQWGFWPTSASC